MLTHKTALVVEDERSLQQVIKMKLENSGYTVLTARSASEAIAHLSDMNTIDFVWLDHYLFGDGDGLDIVKHIRTNKDVHIAKLPIFVVSNTASKDKVDDYYAYQIDKFYIKAEHQLEEIVADIQKEVV